ncbi:MAG: hypothetical protein VXZ38_12915 [Planctomycetota bacterium]|nr:hypothetical protein [Planctomycetota bacterium]
MKYFGPFLGCMDDKESTHHEREDQNKSDHSAKECEHIRFLLQTE